MWHVRCGCIWGCLRREPTTEPWGTKGQHRREWADREENEVAAMNKRGKPEVHSIMEAKGQVFLRKGCAIIVATDWRRESKYYSIFWQKNY